MITPQLQQRSGNLRNHYDVAIVGGGIYGAAAAWEAASRGLDVVLIERADFSSGTSANSLKTIHGGLRSLQRLDFREMREYIRERRALMRIAPHLIQPMPCVMPTYRSLPKSRLFIGAGLKLYDLVAFDRNLGLDEAHKIPSGKIIARKRLAEIAPHLDLAAVTGGARWYDGQVYNSERLTLSFIMSAMKAGASVANYMEKTAYHFYKGEVCGASLKDRLSGEEFELKLRAVIDCTGPWACQDKHFSDIDPGQKPQIMARAVNLVIRRRLSDCALGVRSRTGSEANDRLLFIAPWRNGSIVGTWYYANPAPQGGPGLDETELADCLTQINSVFPAHKLDYPDISLLHIGLQPAYRSKGDDREPRLWRHTRILNTTSRTAQRGIYWVQGVKLTTARATATEVVERVARYLQKSISPSRTQEMPLYGADFGDYSNYRNHCHAVFSGQYKDQAIKRMLANYGSHLDTIAQYAEQDKSQAELVPGTADTIRAELKFVIENEMPKTLTDVLMRRTDLGSFARPQSETLEFCADMMTEYYNWNQAQRQKNIDDLLQCYPSYSH
jgi:glycerol-3-phosphate dehydrogenase